MPGTEPPALGHASCADGFGWSVHLLAKTFCLSVRVQVWLCSEGGEVAPSLPEIFEEKRKTQSSIWLFTSLCRLLAPALMWHVFYTYNFYEESTGWQLEPRLLLLIWITVLGCSPLRARAEWHCGNLLAWSPGCRLLPSPSRDYRSRPCAGFPIRSRVSWEHPSEPLRFAPLVRLRCRCQGRLLCRRSRDVGPLQGWPSGGWLPPLPTGYERQGYAGLAPASVRQAFSAMCNCCFVATLTRD